MQYSIEIDGKRIALGWRNAVVGRSDACKVVLSGDDVSRRHARLRVVERELRVEDLSENGVLLNGIRVSKAARLSDGDRLEIGAHVLTVRIHAGRETPPPVSSGAFENEDDFSAGPATQGHDGFALLEATAVAMLDLGQKDQITQLLAPKLQATLIAARRSGKLAPSVCHQASRVALFLANNGIDGYWADYVLDLHGLSGAAMTKAVAERFVEAVGTRGAPVGRGRLAAYVGGLEKKAADLDDDAQAALALLRTASRRA